MREDERNEIREGEKQMDVYWFIFYSLAFVSNEQMTSNVLESAHWPSLVTILIANFKEKRRERSMLLKV